MTERAVGGDSCAEERGDGGEFGLELGRDAVNVALVDDDVVGVAAVGDLSGVVLGVVGADEALLAIGLFMGDAVAADAAGVDHDAYSGEVAFLEALDVGADGGDAANDLMTWDHGVHGAAPLVADLMDVGVADAAVEDLDDDVGWAGIAAFEAEGGEGGGLRLGGVAFGLQHGFS